MKKKHALYALPLAALLLAACGDDEEVTTAPENAPTEQEKEDTISTSENAPFNFAKFSLDVDYGVTKNVEVDYSNESSGVEASYTNDTTDTNLTGDEAYSYLEPIFKTFTFDGSSSQDDVIQQVIDGFKLDQDFNELDVEITFDNGTEVEFTSKK